MSSIVIESHARRRMRERDVTPEEVAFVWANNHHERASADHPGFVVRTGKTPAGRSLAVVARDLRGQFRVKTVWQVRP